MKKKLPVLLGILQLFVAIGAIPAGLSMICRPDGSGLGMNTSLLQNAPFHDFFIPGLFLFIFNGVINLASAVLSFFKNKYTGLLGVCLGTILIAWICIQSYMIGLIRGHIKNLGRRIIFEIKITIGNILLAIFFTSKTSGSF